MSKRRRDELDELLDEILTDAYDEEEQLWALRQGLEDAASLPCAATIAGEPVTVTKFDYDGNARRGITALIRRTDGTTYVVAAADVYLADAASDRYAAAYRRWIGVTPPVRKARRITELPPTKPAAPAGNIDAVILSVMAKAMRCRILDSGEEVTVRAGTLWDVVPGEIATIRPAKRWIYGGNPYLSGNIESKRLDAKAIGLTPLELRPCGEWDPAHEYWGEPGDPIPAWAKRIIKRGRRPRFEMEQVLPGQDIEDPMSDPILESTDRKDAGDYSGAHDILMDLCRIDLRCLDAHAHLGNLLFDTRPKQAIRHYEVGVRIGELSLPADFAGALPWGRIDNRPFLRCLSGYGLCLWRLERFDEARTVFERMLWLNPTDNQGVRFLLDPVRQRRAWRP